MWVRQTAGTLSMADRGIATVKVPYLRASFAKPTDRVSDQSLDMNSLTSSCYDR